MRSTEGRGRPTAGAQRPPSDALGSNGSTPSQGLTLRPPGRPYSDRANPSAADQETGPSERRNGNRRAKEIERKTTLQVATLNVNGFGSLVRDHPENKWGRIYRMMSDHRIGVLLVQETHLTNERKAGLHDMFARKLRIYHSENPDAPTQREGVAIVLNTRYVDTSTAVTTEIVPGRALQITIACQGGDARHILCIYAPTSTGINDRKRFFMDVQEYYDTHPALPKPHVMAGDFNNVEDHIDRLPIGEGPDASIMALDDLKLSLGLMLADGWRTTYPNARDYTFHRGTGREATFSRLDRIYVSPAIFDGAREWSICEAGIKTDHSLVLVQLTADNAPVIGPGRPLFPLKLTKDKKLSVAIKARGNAATLELAQLSSAPRTDQTNPQTILYNFKKDAMKLARIREREIVPKLLAEIREGERALRKLKADRNIPEQTKLAEAASLTKQVRQLRQQRYKQQQMNARATHRLFGDRPTKYWSRLHRECAPRDIINAFEREGVLGTSGEKLYESDSTKMAKMARRHHMDVQRDDPSAKAANEREADITIALDSLDASLTEDQAEKMGEAFTYEECERSLRFAKNGTAPGLDGIPFEFWKALHARYIEDKRFPDRANFNVMELLTAAFEDARIHGVSTRTSFAHGWIAPIYKEKGERTRVVNYRPITLLNTDYKLLSKALAVRLADVAPKIVNKAQAGFVPGRKIQNHTQLARMVMSWAEMNEEDGAIVALDQEKAYDKVAHDYLWKVLERFGLPATFIRLIRSLYSNAVTSIMINGILSEPYRIYRGVRQGDPLSCLLFDLAIEPLSAMIRKSELRGFKVPRSEETLKAVLFADDTTVYLSHEDDFKALQDVLDIWCSAAKARFNIAKTEIIPLGSAAFRTRMAETYRDTGEWYNYPQGVHVAQDGEAVRILGAFFGNGVDQVDIWSVVLTKIVAMRKPLVHAMQRWSAGHATLHGKKHVIQMIVGGMTQFFTTVQRMPEIILKRLTKIIRGYLWDERCNTPVGMEHVYLPVSLGGLGILDLSSRSDAVDIMWLKAYMDCSENRPTWAYFADDILATHVPKHCRPKSASLRINPFMQKWKPRARGLPPELKAIMSVAKRYGLRLEVLAPSKHIRESMPMWDHLYADRKRLGRLTVPSKLLTCLQTKHLAKTVGDISRLAEVLACAAHGPRKACKCAGCAYLRTSVGCDNPHLCGSRARDLLATLPSRWDPRERAPEAYEQSVMDGLQQEGNEPSIIPFDRRVTTEGDIGQAFRVFTDPGPVSGDVIQMELLEDGSRVTVATDGSCLRNGEQDAQAGAGVFFGSGNRLNACLRLPKDMDQSNQTGEMSATLVATVSAPTQGRLTQETDSRTTLDSVTKWKQRHEDTGYILQSNASLIRALVARLRMRKAHTLFRWIKGHDGHPGNEAADVLAGIGARKPSGDNLDLEVPLPYRITGAKLQAMTQKLAYRAIRARKEAKVKPRPRTMANIDRIVCGVKAAFGFLPPEATVWTSLRSKHVSRSASQFMWMATHDGYMIGTHWLRPNMSAVLQERATCRICEECETMTHIMFECRATGQETVWELLKQLWRLTGYAWKPPSWGTAFGAACAVFKSEDGRRRPAAENLWCILCTEAAHLIWKLRCERVIQKEGEEHSNIEVTNRLYAALDSRLTLDRRTAAIARGRKALKPQDVERIWSPIIEHKDSLPPRWVVDSGVLVGIKRGR